MMDRRAVVTGGAGLIGSHLVDLLLRDGWGVRIFDNLEPQTHLHGAPSWIPGEAELLLGDMRDRNAVLAALQNVDVVFHLAAYGGYMPEMSKYLHVNSFGTAQMLELIRDQNIQRIRKVIVASSQVVYSEGAVVCATHGRQYPPTRPVAQLVAGDFLVKCPVCQGPTTPTLMPEEAPTRGETVYAVTKIDQERLVLIWGQQTGVPTVALRFACTYGPRQSIYNPYTGVIAIFSTRLLSGKGPVIYEDGQQTRDLCFVEDIARGCLLAAESDRVDGEPVNIGSGRASSVHDLVRMVSEELDIHLTPIMRGEFRPGEIRQLTADISRAEAIGYSPTLDLASGISRYIQWIKTQGDVKDYFAAAEQVLRSKRIVHRVQIDG